MTNTATFLPYPAVYTVTYMSNGKVHTGEIKLMVLLRNTAAREFIEDLAKTRYGKDIKLADFEFARQIK